jgi:hypothetical protein
VVLEIGDEKNGCQNLVDMNDPSEYNYSKISLSLLCMSRHAIPKILRLRSVHARGRPSVFPALGIGLRLNFCRPIHVRDQETASLTQ